MAKIQAVPQDQVEQIQNLPTNQEFVQMANLTGLQDWAAARGLPTGQEQPVPDAMRRRSTSEVQLTSDVSTQYPDFPGTPTFIINGTDAQGDGELGESSSRSSTRR